MWKNRKLYFMMLSLACFIAMGVCVIVNTAVSGTITWAMYPLTAIPFGWALSSLLLIRRWGILLSLTALTVCVFPFLYVTDKISPASGWFWPMGGPVTIAGLAALWVIFLLFRFTRMRIWYKGALAVFLMTAVVSPVINYHIACYVGTLGEEWLDIFINIFAGTAAAATLGIVGYARGKKQ